MKIDVMSTLDKAYGLREKNNTRKTALNVSTNNSSDKVKKSDSLEISTNVRKIQMIKSRVETGAYNDEQVINEIARRLIEYSEL